MMCTAENLLITFCFRPCRWINCCCFGYDFYFTCSLVLHLPKTKETIATYHRVNYPFCNNEKLRDNEKIDETGLTGQMAEW